MAICFKCTNCGKTTTVDDPINPGDCECGVSLRTAQVTVGEENVRITTASNPNVKYLVEGMLTKMKDPATKAVDSPGVIRTEATSTHHEIVIPEPKYSHDTQCPGCRSRVAANAAICTKCGYDFKNHRVLETRRPGMVFGTDEEEEELIKTRIEEEPGFFRRNALVLKLGIVLVLLGSVGAGVYFATLESRTNIFGLSGKNPIGKPISIQSYLESLGLQKEEEGARILYSNPVLGKDEQGHFHESAFLAFDDEENFVGVGAEFWTGDSPGDTSVQKFVHLYWTHLGGETGGDRINRGTYRASWNEVIGAKQGPFHQEKIRVALRRSEFEKEIVWKKK